jgi:DNA-binding transcriptional LysR family regulator
VRDLRADPSGLLRLSAPVGLGAEYVVPAVARFAAAHPRLRVEVNLEDRYVHLVEEGIDLAIRAGTLAVSSLVARRLAPVTSVVCGSPAYFDRYGIPAEPSQLTRHDWVQYTPLSSRLRFRRENRMQTVTLKGRLRTNSGDATIVLLREGYGLSLCPMWIVREDLAAGRLKAVLTDYETRRAAIYAVYPEGKNLLPRVRLFVEYLAESFAGADWTKIEPGWVARG